MDEELREFGLPSLKYEIRKTYRKSMYQLQRKISLVKGEFVCTIFL